MDIYDGGDRVRRGRRYAALASGAEDLRSRNRPSDAPRVDHDAARRSSRSRRRGALVAVGLWWLVNRTRIGMLIRAGADDRDMVDGLGVDIGKLYTLVFGLGALLCGLAGVMAAPLLAVEIGMGERILITTFVVIVIGGVGSVRGALVGALLVGMVDSLGRAFLPQLLGTMFAASTADTLAAGLASASIYVLMAIVLIVKPGGLFPARG